MTERITLYSMNIFQSKLIMHILHNAFYRCMTNILMIASIRKLINSVWREENILKIDLGAAIPES